MEGRSLPGAKGPRPLETFCAIRDGRGIISSPSPERRLRRVNVFPTNFLVRRSSANPTPSRRSPWRGGRTAARLIAYGLAARVVWEARPRAGGSWVIATIVDCRAGANAWETTAVFEGRRTGEISARRRVIS